MATSEMQLAKLLSKPLTTEADINNRTIVDCLDPLHKAEYHRRLLGGDGAPDAKLSSSIKLMALLSRPLTAVEELNSRQVIDSLHPTDRENYYRQLLGS